MGIFGDGTSQDDRFDALENHVRLLTETVQRNQADLAAGWIAILALQAQVDEKLSPSDVAPTLDGLKKSLGQVRVELGAASVATAESWSTLQRGVHASFETLRDGVNAAADRLKPR